MSVTHNKVATLPDDPAYEVGSTEWNQAHTGVIDNTMHGTRGSNLHTDSHLATTINVKDAAYGATGLGVADDSTAVQAAIAALPAGGGIIFFPPGNYLLTTGLTIGKGVRLIGAGKHASILLGNSAGINVITTNSGAGGGQEIAHLQVQAGSATGVGINLKGVDHAYVHDCRFYQTVDAHIVLDNNNVAGAYTHRIENNEIDCTVRATSVGIRLTNTQGSPNSGITSTVIARNHIISDAPVQFVNMAGGHGGNVFYGNLLQARTSGVGVGIDFTANCNDDMVFGNYLQNFASGIQLASGAGATLAFSIFGNYWENNTAKITNNNTVSTTGLPKSNVSVPIANAVGIVGSPALAAQGTNSKYIAWALDAAADEAVSFGPVALPENYFSGALVIKLHWTNLSSGSGDVSWRVFLVARSDTDDLNSTTSVSSPSDAITAPAQNILKVSTHSATFTPVAGQDVLLSVRRNGSAGGDTLGNDAGLVGVEIEYVSAS